MAKYKPVFKGVRYITNKILKYYPKRYASRTLASQQAHEIYDKLKASGTKVTLRNAFKLIPPKELKNPPKQVAPVLDIKLLEQTNYFHLLDYPLLILSTPEKPELVFESNIIPVGLEPIMAGFEYDYTDYFKPYVDYIDKLRANEHSTMYSYEWYVRCTEPVYNKDKKIYISRIIGCDADGEENEYGYSKNDPDALIIKYDASNKPLPKVKPIESNIDKQIELLKQQELTAREIKGLLDAGVPYTDIKKIFFL